MVTLNMALQLLFNQSVGSKMTPHVLCMISQLLGQAFLSTTFVTAGSNCLACFEKHAYIHA